MSDSLAYNKRRAHLILSGRWNPWADPEPVRARINQFRSLGATWEQIGRASGVGHMTIWGLCNGRDRIKQSTAERIMSVSPADLGLSRIPADGPKWRLRSLIALGHSIARIARALDVRVDTISTIVNSEMKTVSVQLASRITQLFDCWWDRRPPERNPREMQAATRARTRAAAEGWPTPANLDEDQLDIPGYRPSFGWRPATGVGIADDYPLGQPEEAA